MIAQWRYRRRIATCHAQWPDACALIANALRAGLSLQQAVELAATEAPFPLRDEWQRVVADLAVGRRLDAALMELHHRLPGEGVATVAFAVAVLHATGGNLVAVFDRVVEIVREQRRVQQRIRTLTAQGVTTGAIVTALPFCLIALLACGMPQFVQPLFTTVLGRCCLIAALILQTLGFFWIRRIVRIRI